ncbi:MAG TPA: CBS domain-containing protein [Acidimicrobiia bacterium]
MQVNELISAEVASCTPDTTLTEAAKLMVAHETGSLAVVDGDGDLIGIVTERDVLELIADEGDPEITSVSEVMTPDPDYLEPDVDVRYAADWMLAAGYRHLLVRNESGKLLGVLSIKDVLWGVTQGREPAL